MAKVMKKAQTGKKLLTPARTRQVADSLDYEAARKKSGAFSALRSGKNDTYKYGMEEGNRNADNAKRYRSLADKSEGKKPEMKKGGKMTKAVKAKDGKWIQKAVNPKHKGYCTPMTKATCTPKRKALAKTFKAMGRARKGK